MNVIVIQTQVNCNYSNYYSFNKVQMHVSKSSWVLHYTNKKATKPYDGSAANLLGSLFYNKEWIKEYDYSVFHVDGNTTKEFSVKLTKITIIVLAVFTLSEIIQATNLSVSTKAHVIKSRHLREYRSRIKVETWSHFCTLHFGPHIFTISSNRMVQQLFS